MVPLVIPFNFRITMFWASDEVVSTVPMLGGVISTVKVTILLICKMMQSPEDDPVPTNAA